MIFNWILFSSHVPESFRRYLKEEKNLKSVMNCEDFRAISISSVVAKIFESCLLNIFGDWLNTDNAQFGFKKGVGCAHAIFSANIFISDIVKGKGTAHVLSLDVAKAFPRVNRYSILSRLVKKNCPIALLNILEKWLLKTVSAVRWENYLSFIF